MQVAFAPVNLRMLVGLLSFWIGVRILPEICMMSLMKRVFLFIDMGRIFR